MNRKEFLKRFSLGLAATPAVVKGLSAKQKKAKKKAKKQIMREAKGIDRYNGWEYGPMT